jgi:hypothetical protein
VIQSVILICETKFIVDVFKKSLQGEHISCFDFPDYNSLEYQVKDLAAELVIVDEELWNDEILDLVERDTLVYLGKVIPSKLSIKHLQKPLDPLKIADSLRHFITAN